MYACSENRVEAVRELIKCGANLNIQNENGYTSLMMSASLGHFLIVKV